MAIVRRVREMLFNGSGDGWFEEEEVGDEDGESVEVEW